MQHAAIDLEAEVNCPQSESSEASSYFPGIVLLHDGRPCAAMGYSREPCSTVAIFPPVVFFDANDHVRCRLYDTLLNRIVHRFVEDGFRQINFLQQDSSIDAIFLRLLAEQRFVPAARILQWELSASLGFAAQRADLQNQDTPVELRHGDRTIHRLDIAKAEADDVREVQTVLDAILRSSDDLLNQPRPQAYELLRKWQAIHASVFTCRTQGKIVGILCCVASMATNPATEIKKKCDVESYLSLEYIGVVREFRRRGLASWLIEQMRLRHQSVRDMASESASVVPPVKAFSDAANAPATAFYLSVGFNLAAEMQLWCCQLKNDRSEISVPTRI